MQRDRDYRMATKKPRRCGAPAWNRYACLFAHPDLLSAQEGDATRHAELAAVVEIYQAKDGRLAGKVVEVLDLKDGPNPKCDKCTGGNHGKPIKGMLILWGLRPDGAGQWSGGRVLDPENGKDYKAKLELLDGGRKLGMSGCIAFLCRQQAWVRE